MRWELNEVLDSGGGVVSRAEYPEHARAMEWARRQGELVPVLRGVYARADAATRRDVLARAVRLRDPGSVVVRESAAVLMGWGEVPIPAVLQVASVRLRSREDFLVERRRVPAGLRRRADGFVTTSRALTALDLVDTMGGRALDDALRRGVTLAELRRACEQTGHRRGHALRRLMLDDSRDQPWSPAERAAHRALRGASDITGWVANKRIYDRHGELLAVGDLVFEDQLLVIEIDGEGYHLTATLIERDYARDLRLARAGWTVVRIPASLVVRNPGEFVRSVRDITSRRGQLRR